MRRRRDPAAAAAFLALLLTCAGGASGVPDALGQGLQAGPGTATDPLDDPLFSWIAAVQAEGRLGPQAAQRMHPEIQFLDAGGALVTDSGGPLSLTATCGGCHDTRFIEQSNYHAQAGFDERSAPGRSASGRPWDTSPGMFGRWNPLTYRVLSPDGDALLDMGTAEWVKVMGARHAGGGPAQWSRCSGRALSEIPCDAPGGPETHVLGPGPGGGEPVPWDWKASGTVELNCLLCHMRAPQNAARVEALRKGRFRWASTATLEGTGLVEETDRGYRWLREGFDDQGRPVVSAFRITRPESGNCRLCHGKACRCRDPVVFENSLENWGVETTGEIFSPEQLAFSGMNLRGKEALHLPWDIHAARLLQCADCHHAVNNPARVEKAGPAGPAHLRFDARRLSYDEYLHRPDHDLAKGRTAQGTVSRRLGGTVRHCRDCHDAEAVHEFLPYKKLHFLRLDCRACHIPRVYAPVRMVTDWTVITPQGGPVLQHKGVAGEVNDPASLITGYEPALLEFRGGGEPARLTPAHLLASWFWVAGDPERPVRVADLERAFLEPGGGYHPEILAALDTDRDGRLGPEELRLDDAEKAARTAARLERVGVAGPRIRAELQPYTLSHGVASGRFAVRDCGFCHAPGSRVTRPVDLSAYVPGGVVPRPVGDSTLELPGEFVSDRDGLLRFHPAADPERFYIHGAGRWTWMDAVGALVLAGSLAGVGLHGGARAFSARTRKRGRAAA